MPGIIGIPCQEMLFTPAAVALHRMVMSAPSGSMEYFLDHPFPVHVKRNMLVRSLLQSSNADLEWLVMIDSDMLPPEDVVQRLEPQLEDYDVIGALSYARRPPYPACAGVRTTEGEEYLDPSSVADLGTAEVEWVGTGCVMISRRVLTRLSDPWFVANENGRGEDINFMRNVRNAGFRIGCAIDIEVGHLGLIDIDRTFATKWSSSHTEEEGRRMAQRLWAQPRPTGGCGEGPGRA